MMANFDFAMEYGNSFDIKNFISLANANPAAQSISRDLLVGATAVFIWIVNAVSYTHLTLPTIYSV